MIVFEKGSLGRNTPNERFAIDPGHPMCTIKDYLKKGVKGLRPAKMYINRRSIYSDTIDSIHHGGLLESNIRYDLVLENSDVYIANNVIVKARMPIKK